jgi:hypothetical protein
MYTGAREDVKMKCDELKEYKAYEYGTSYVYDIGEVKEAIAELKARIQLDDDEMAGFLQLEEECGGGDLRNYIAELKAKLEDVQASHYAEMVDAGMRERRLKRALFIAHAIKAKFKWWWITECKHNESCKILPDPRKIKKFTNTAWVCSKSQEKCREKAEEYK